MQIYFNGSVIAISIVIVLGFFSAIVLARKKENVLANRLLAAFLFITALWLIDVFFSVSGIYRNSPDMYFKPIYYSFAFGPLIYFYVKSLTEPTFQFHKKHILHFVPVIIQAGLYFFLNLKDYSFKRWYWLEIHQPYTYRLEFDGTFISLAFYLFFSILLVRRYQKKIADHYSDLDNIQLNWLRALLILLLILCLQWFVEVILRDFYDSYYQFNYTTFILGILTIVLAYRGVTQSGLGFIEFDNNDSLQSESNYAVEIDDNILSKIRYEMIDEEAFLNSDLTLKLFANQCKLPSRKISEHINHGLKKSFHDFVNEQRVEKIKSKLQSADLTKYTIQGLAYECGFNSKATFNRIFKSFTNLTPSQYVAQITSK